MRAPENACVIIDGVAYCTDHSGCLGAPCTYYERSEHAQTTVARGVGCKFLRWGTRCANEIAISEAKGTKNVRTTV